MLKKIIIVVAGTLAFGTLASAHPRDEGRRNDYYRVDADSHLQQDRNRLQRDLARRDHERRELQAAIHHGDVGRIHAEQHELGRAESRVQQDIDHLRQERGFRRAGYDDRY